MMDPRQFGASKAARKDPSGPLDCAAVELWLAEWAEQTLPATVTEQIQTHATGCAACVEKLAQARRGREWLLVLKQEALEPPADLVAKILARTSGAGADTMEAGVDGSRVTAGDGRGISAAMGASVFGGSAARGKKERGGKNAGHVRGEESDVRAIPAWQHSSVVVLRRTFIEPRLALVAAMAFFSVALTLNLLGVRLTSLHASDLRPRNMHRAVTRQYADANARVVRYYENLRIVYEVEARVQQLRRAAETTPPPEQQTKPRKQSSDSTGNPDNSASDSRRGPMTDTPLARENRHSAPSALPDPRPVTAGPRLDAALGESEPITERAGEHTLATSFVPSLAFQPALLASSCPVPTICFSMHSFPMRERRLA